MAGPSPWPVPTGNSTPLRFVDWMSPSGRRSGYSMRQTGNRCGGSISRTSTSARLPISPDGQTLAAGVGDRTIRRYDPSTGSERLPRLGRDQAEPLPKDGEQVRKWYEDAARSASALAFSQDGSLLVSGQESIGWLNGRTDESFLSIWDIASGRQVHRFFGHYGGTSALAFAPDGKIFASAGGETVVRTWDPASGRESEPRPGHKGQHAELAISPADGDCIHGRSILIASFFAGTQPPATAWEPLPRD